MTEQSEKTISFGEREFYLPVDRSISNDLFVEAETEKAGLRQLQIEPGETTIDFARRTTNHVIRSGRIFPLLGALLFPVGVEIEDWTPAIAAATAAHLARVTDEDEKGALRVLVANTVSGFFLGGLASATTSATSSSAIASDLESSSFPAPSIDVPNVVH